MEQISSLLLLSHLGTLHNRMTVATMMTVSSNQFPLSWALSPFFLSSMELIDQDDDGGFEGFWADIDCDENSILGGYVCRIPCPTDEPTLSPTNSSVSPTTEPTLSPLIEDDKNVIGISEAAYAMMLLVLLGLLVSTCMAYKKTLQRLENARKTEQYGRMRELSRAEGEQMQNLEEEIRDVANILNHPSL